MVSVKRAKQILSMEAVADLIRIQSVSGLLRNLSRVRVRMIVRHHNISIVVPRCSVQMDAKMENVSSLQHHRFVITMEGCITSGTGSKMMMDVIPVSAKRMAQSLVQRWRVSMMTMMR
jgi:hypothetical protein|tara:strand:+ start:179 stop:532 length:354 start_codon:yes stop_codon:yes gene_type:complete